MSLDGLPRKNQLWLTGKIAQTLEFSTITLSTSRLWVKMEYN